MRVLAIDTALAACSAAILDTSYGGILASESLPMVRGHAEALMPLLARVMKASGMAFRDLDRVVVTTGPGSFTGLRVAGKDIRPDVILPCHCHRDLIVQPRREVDAFVVGKLECRHVLVGTA